MAAVQAPIIPEVTGLIATHPGTISLGQGMVRYGPPSEARRQLEGFWEEPGAHEYGAVPGHGALRAALTEKLRRDNGIVVGGESFLLITAGSNMAFLQALLAIAEPGDEVILFAPYYFNHEMAVGIAGCRSVVLDVGEGFLPDVEHLEAALGEKTRAVVTVSPNNPTGAVYPEGLLQRINRLCQERGVYHLHDEAYEVFVYGGAEAVSPGSFPEANGHTISLFSFSKSHGFAGWRVGYGVFPAHLESALMKIQDTNLICPPVVSQVAALGALDAGPSFCRERVQELSRVRDMVLAEVETLGPHLLRAPVADGAMYVFLELDTPRSGFDLTADLIRHHGVAPLPGETFGITDRSALRVSYGALAPETVAEGIGRLVRGLAKLLD